MNIQAKQEGATMPLNGMSKAEACNQLLDIINIDDGRVSGGRHGGPKVTTPAPMLIEPLHVFCIRAAPMGSSAWGILLGVRGWRHF